MLKLLWCFSGGVRERQCEWENEQRPPNGPPQTSTGSSNNTEHHCYCADQIIELYKAEGLNSPAGAMRTMEMLQSSGALTKQYATIVLELLFNKESFVAVSGDHVGGQFRFKSAKMRADPLDVQKSWGPLRLDTHIQTHNVVIVAHSIDYTNGERDPNQFLLERLAVHLESFWGKQD